MGHTSLKEKILSFLTPTDHGTVRNESRKRTIERVKDSLVLAGKEKDWDAVLEHDRMYQELIKTSNLPLKERFELSRDKQVLNYVVLGWLLSN